MEILDIYKNFKIQKLPINPIELFDEKIKLLTYENFLKYTDLNYQQLLDISSDGFTVYKEGFYLIAYNKKIGSIGRRRFTIMHEVSHILLGHICQNQPLLTREVKKRDRQEKEADNLAIDIMCPLVVLHFCNVSSVSEIRKLCDISNEATIFQLQRLSDFREKFSENLKQKDKELLLHFSDFISKHITTQLSKSNTQRAFNYHKKALIFADDIDF
jgi:Zn-dependent peptidase ImmA (M78 family)